MSSALPDPADWVNALVELVDLADRNELARSPITVIPDLFAIDITLRPETDSATCPLHGTYFTGSGSITVVETASRGRVRFSALHELAHHLITTHDVRLDLLDYDEPRDVEESICDAFAAAILLPDELIDQHISENGPTAAEIAALWAASNASRAATCVAAATRLPSAGYVMLTDLNARALFTAAHRTKFRVRADTDQGEGSLSNKAIRHGHSRGPTSVRFGTGGQSPTYQGDAVVEGDYVFAVYILTNAPWVSINWIEPDSRRRAERPCPRCGEAFVRWANLICGACHEPKCPHCEQCACRKPTTRTEVCTRCYMTKSAHLMEDAICRDCR